MATPSKVVHTTRNNYASSPVTTAAWVEIEDALPANVNALEIFDSSGQTMLLGYGPAGSEITALQILPGGNSIQVTTLLNQGMRLALKAVSANATVGENTINYYK